MHGYKVSECFLELNWNVFLPDLHCFHEANDIINESTAGADASVEALKL